MQHYLTIFLVVSAPNLVLGNSETPAATCVASDQRPFLVLKAESLTDDLRVALERLFCVYRVYKKKELTEEQKTELKGIFGQLENLPGRSREDVAAIFRKYADDMIQFYLKMDAFVLQKSMEERPRVGYQEILEYHDKKVLQDFASIRHPESEVLLTCTKYYMSRFLADEKNNYKHSPSSLALCMFRQLVLDMAAELKMFNDETAQEIANILLQVYPDAAAVVYTEGYITGEYLALPLVLAEKMLQILPRRRFANMALSKPGAAEGASSLASSLLAPLMEQSGPSVEAAVGTIIDLMVKYYESLGGSVFCQLKKRTLESFGPYSMTYLAFARSKMHACISD